jgi:D-sedoheptulose 7-phosphate isomerase
MNQSRAVSERIEEFLLAGSEVLRETARVLQAPILQAAEQIASTIRSGHKILVCGNGGSAADAQHFAAELVGRYRQERAAWPAIALTVDTSILTAVGNDYGFGEVFVRQVHAVGQPGDVLLAISTSGKSPNILGAVETAKQRQILTIGLTGAANCPLRHAADICLQVPSSDTPLIQQAHLAVLHVICETLEDLIP